MNNNPRPEEILRGPKAFHRLVITATLAIMALAVFAAYASISKPPVQEDEMQVASGGEKGPAKPLPDYMLETLTPDELEILKP